MTRSFLTAHWRNLLMLNYVVDPALLLPFVPRGTELDLWQGRAYVSIVGFIFDQTRLLGFPVPFHTRFEEVNLRFYVVRETGAERRRGVTFLKELVPRTAIAAVARWTYNEPYEAVPMSHTIVVPTEDAPGTVEYGWVARSGSCRISAVIAGQPAHVEPASEAEFITEHYWGYTTQRDASTVEYRVEHPPWRVWEATHASVSGELAGTYGAAVAGALRGAPASVFVAEGSAVNVRAPERLGSFG